MDQGDKVIRDLGAPQSRDEKIGIRQIELLGSILVELRAIKDRLPNRASTSTGLGTVAVRPEDDPAGG